MKSTGWSNTSTFEKFYNKLISTENFGAKVLENS
jgi:hypothetical protein